MWELMNIGIEMQERMIEAHAKGLELTRDMLEQASAKQGDMAQAMDDAMQQAGQAHAAFIDQWLDYWRHKG